MIARYSLPEMASLWTDEARYATWLEVELAACRVMVERKIMPAASYRRLQKKARVDVGRILEVEARVKHDVIAFTMTVEEQAGVDARYFHWGLTSSDVLDTALALQMNRALRIILQEVDSLARSLARVAQAYRSLPAIGRSHGIHAETLSFGQKFLGAYAELMRNRARIEAARRNISVGALSGAVGSYGTHDPSFEKKFCRILGLEPEAISTQVIPRDRHAEVFQSLALLGAGLERLAVELRHLQRTEVGEVEEGFAKGQKGSSAMPHKKNPISAENLTGCARLLRSYAEAAMENVALWHERDISHSSVERVIAPDATILAHYMLVRMRRLVDGLRVNRARVKANLGLTRGLVHSGSALLALVEAGMERDSAYRLVQKHAMAAWEGGSDLLTRLLADREALQYLDRKRLKAAFDDKRGLRHVDAIYREVFRRWPAPKKA
ncbi:MAG: adenylosuccinate lyase [Bdellovibrionales bacterium]|nr:adenylosuccinate lyase [Bdellovibrionales bacterium]